MIRRFIATVAIAALGTTVVGVGIALAADIEVTPDQPEAGPAELTIRISAFPPDTPVYAVPCTVPADGADLALGTDNCDVTSVVTGTTDGDGTATLTAEWTIPDEGIAVYVGDETREHQATQIIGPSPDGEATDPEVEVLGTSVVQEDDAEPTDTGATDADDLADTGPREIVLLATIGTALIGLGLALRGAERLRSRPSC